MRNSFERASKLGIVSVFAAVGKPLHALSIADFSDENDAGKRKRNYICQDNRPGPSRSHKHPACNTGAEHDVHTQADVLRSFVTKYFYDLRQISQCGEDACKVSENVEANSDMVSL